MSQRVERVVQWEVGGSIPAPSGFVAVSLGKTLNPHRLVRMQVDVGWWSEGPFLLAATLLSASPRAAVATHGDNHHQGECECESVRCLEKHDINPIHEHYQGRVLLVLVFCLNTLWSCAQTEQLRCFSKSRQAALQFVQMQCQFERFSFWRWSVFVLVSPVPFVSQALMLQWVLVNRTSFCIFFSFCLLAMLHLSTCFFNLDCIFI